jgi:indole-3-glycerol phosphate synthase
MADFLKDVEARTRERVEAQRRQVPLEQLRRNHQSKDAWRPFGKALNKPGKVTVIAELKQASPSAGVIKMENDIPGRVAAYTKGGAAALSILTEEYYFHGSPHLLEAARTQTALPLLRKDFIIDSYQIEESRSLGADALLLIAALLPGGKLKEFIMETRAAGLDALVEVHDDSDLERAIEAGASIIGVNNRNLRSLKVDTATSARLVPRIPKAGKTIVIESGIREPEQLKDFQKWGAHSVLIGETLMRSTDPEAAVRSFAQGVDA